MWRLSRAGSSPPVALGRGCRQAPRASARALLAAHGLACTAGERGVAGNVGRTGSAHGDPDVVLARGGRRRDRRARARDSRRYRRSRRACRPHPPPVPSPPTDHAGAPLAGVDGVGGTTATSHEPAGGSGIATLPSYIDGNVAPDVRAGVSCDVAVVAGTTGHTFPRTQPMPFRRRDASRRPRRRRPTTPARHQDSPRRPGTTATSHERAGGSGFATLPVYIDGNVARDVRAGDACDVAVVVGITGHTLPPYPAHAVTAPRREPTATAPPTDHAGAPPPESRRRRGYDGNVTRTGRRQRDCDVTVVYRRQRRTGRASGRFVRRYRRRRRARPATPCPVPSPCRDRAETPANAHGACPRRRRTHQRSALPSAW
jgi:hypothetical protein